MPNVATLLKAEIVRLARKELRAETEALKKTVAAHRSELAALKRRVATLEKQAAQTRKRPLGRATSASTAAEVTTIRYSAKRLAVQRQKLGLTAADMGTLLFGVSAQTVYNWEAEKSRPRRPSWLPSPPCAASASARPRPASRPRALRKAEHLRWGYPLCGQSVAPWLDARGRHCPGP